MMMTSIGATVATVLYANPKKSVVSVFFSNIRFSRMPIPAILSSPFCRFLLYIRNSYRLFVPFQVHAFCKIPVNFPISFLHIFNPVFRHHSPVSVLAHLKAHLFFLRQKAEKATKGDFPVAIDLLDTLKAHEDGCVGMAANMIGVNKAIIAVNMGFMNVAMFNPKIVKRNGKYETEEGCLSLDGVRKCVRYQEIEVEYEDINFKRQRQKYSGWTAQIIQHECDHLNGIII